MLYKAKNLQDIENTQAEIDGEWIPARPMGHYFDSKLDRIKWAIGVLIGKYDAIDWEH